MHCARLTNPRIDVDFFRNRINQNRLDQNQVTLNQLWAIPLNKGRDFKLINFERSRELNLRLGRGVIRNLHVSNVRKFFFLFLLRPAGSGEKEREHANEGDKPTSRRAVHISHKNLPQAMSALTRSSTAANGSRQATVRVGGAFNLKCTQSTVYSMPRSCAYRTKSPRNFARVVCGGETIACKTSASVVRRRTAPLRSSCSKTPRSCERS